MKLQQAILLCVCAASALCLTACKTTDTASRSKLAAGQYEWQPGRSPSGPVLVVVSIDDQMAYVYRNGVEIARSTVSTGRQGKETPTGVFTVLQRKVEHESSIYKGAQMPYMQRLTWGGIAMHAGDLPGYPASAGCIRLPLEFSEKIYSVMGMGGTVVITKKGAKPSSSSKPANVLLASKASRVDDRAIPAGEVVWEPSKSSTGPFSILVSYGDRTVYVWRNGVQIGQAPIAVLGSNPPEGVFMMLEGTEPPNPKFPGLKMHPWVALSLDGGNTSGDVVETMRTQISLPKEFRKNINQEIVPGAILVATRKSNYAKSSGGGVPIMAPEGAAE